jgi:hypothetical protein
MATKEKLEELAQRSHWVIDCQPVSVDELVEAVLRLRRRDEQTPPDPSDSGSPDK